MAMSQDRQIRTFKQVETPNRGGMVIGRIWHLVAVFVVLCALVVVVVLILPAGATPVWLVLALAAGAYVLVVYRPAELVRLLEAAGRLAGRLSGCLSSVQLAA